jgi:hypothetical protein
MATAKKWKVTVYLRHPGGHSLTLQGSVYSPNELMDALKAGRALDDATRSLVIPADNVSFILGEPEA